jgi:uncharacterized membrane protein YozB (DUF420 family)
VLYLTILTLHNLMRWVVLLAGLWALYRACRGWIGAHPWTSDDRRVGRWFAQALSLQLLIGGVFFFCRSLLPGWRGRIRRLSRASLHSAFL